MLLSARVGVDTAEAIAGSIPSTHSQHDRFSSKKISDEGDHVSRGIEASRLAMSQTMVATTDSSTLSSRMRQCPSVSAGALCCGGPSDSTDPRNGMWTRVRSASVDSHALLGASWRPMVGNLDDSE
jgi:hypothetical protein